MHQRDAALIRDLAPLTVQDYEFLRYSNERSVKDAFIDGAAPLPGLYYRDVDSAYVETCLADIEALTSVVAVYGDEVVRRAYDAKLRETREKYELLRAAAAGDDRAVVDASVRLYGRPRKEYFAYALKQVRDRVARVKGAWNDAQVHELIGRLEPLLWVPEPEHYAWRDVVLPEPVPFRDAPALNAEEIRAAFQSAFNHYGVYDWQAVIDAPGERTTFNTNHELRTVFIPHDEDLRLRKYALTRELVEGLIAHEVGTHVVRRVRGEQSPLALLGIGLAGYLRGEEGVATYAEQVLEGTRHFAGGLGYLAVGWVMGLDGTPRDFRGLYEVLYPYLVLSSLEHALAYGEEVSLDALLKQAKRKAWARCVRTFRGTSGSTPGACFTKDIVYLEGNIAIWQLVTADPVWKDRFLLGKYDPANEEHVAILRDLGMIV